MSKKNIISIDADDDNNDYESFSKSLIEHTNLTKNKIAKEVEMLGLDMLNEIEIKRKQQEKKKKIYIKYILKHSKLLYLKSELESYSYGDITEIYLEIKNKKLSFFKKIFEFLYQK